MLALKHSLLSILFLVCYRLVLYCFVITPSHICGIPRAVSYGAVTEVRGYSTPWSHVGKELNPGMQLSEDRFYLL